jgi:hypothetical protein
MARRHRGTKRRGTKRRGSRGRGQRGGGAGIGGYTFGGPITPGAPVGNTAEVLPMDSCQAATRFGLVSQSTGAGTGLPGMRGGKRRGRGTKRHSRRRPQRGGRYGFDLSAPVAPAAPWAGGIPQVMRIPCEAARPNPLNAQAGGAPGGTGSPYMTAQTAGYTNEPSPWVGSTGAPSMIQAPYAAGTMNPACLKTGGGRKRGHRGSKRGRRGTKRGHRGHKKH